MSGAEGPPSSKDATPSRRKVLEGMVGVAAVAAAPKIATLPTQEKLIEAAATKRMEASSMRLAQAKLYFIDVAEKLGYQGDRTPWKINETGTGRAVELNFHEKELGELIYAMPDSPLKQQCDANLSKVYALSREEKAALEAEAIAPPMEDCEPRIKELEQIFDTFETKENLQTLHAITDAKEALLNPARIAALEVRSVVTKQLEILKKQTNITDERYQALMHRRKTIWLAIGAIDPDGTINHTR